MIPNSSGASILAKVTETVRTNRCLKSVPNKSHLKAFITFPSFFFKARIVENYKRPSINSWGNIPLTSYNTPFSTSAFLRFRLMNS